MGAVACASEAQSQCSFLSPSILSCRPSTPPPSASSTWPTCFGRRRASAWAACPLGRACRTRRASRGSGEKGRKTRGVEVRGQPSLSLFFHDPPFRARTHTHTHTNKHARTEASIRTHYAALGQPPQNPPLTPVADHPAFRLWVPGLALSKASTPAPRARIVAFPCAGSAEDMYSAHGTGVRRAASPLLV